MCWRPFLSTGTASGVVIIRAASITMWVGTTVIATILRRLLQLKDQSPENSERSVDMDAVWMICCDNHIVAPDAKMLVCPECAFRPFPNGAQDYPVMSAEEFAEMMEEEIVGSS